jgi:hypothetical protein
MSLQKVVIVIFFHKNFHFPAYSVSSDEVALQKQLVWAKTLVVEALEKKKEPSVNDMEGIYQVMPESRLPLFR